MDRPAVSQDLVFGADDLVSLAKPVLNEQGALRTTRLELPMLAAVDLDQLANTVAAMPRLINPGLAIAAADPDVVTFKQATGAMGSDICIGDLQAKS